MNETAAVIMILVFGASMGVLGYLTRVVVVEVRSWKQKPE